MGLYRIPTQHMSDTSVFPINYVSVASCERSFSKLKLIKNYLRSTMTEKRFASLAILTIERKAASVLDFDDVINKFSALKARKNYNFI